MKYPHCHRVHGFDSPPCEPKEPRLPAEVECPDCEGEGTIYPYGYAVDEGSHPCPRCQHGFIDSDTLTDSERAAWIKKHPPEQEPDDDPDGFDRDDADREADRVHGSKENHQ